MSLKNILIALVAVIVVLVAALAYVLLTPNPTTSPNTASTTGGTSAQTAPQGMPGASGTTQAPATEFDPAKATKAVGTPKAHVEKYFSSIVKNDFVTAFKLLPIEKQSQGQQAFADQIKAYGMTKFTIDSDKVSGDSEVVEATVQTSGGPFSYTWTFVKNKGAWLLKSRDLSGMGQ